MVNKGGPAGANHKTPNAFIAAFDTTKSGPASLIFSTFLGGTGSSDSTQNGDIATGIAIDGAGKPYVVGITYSQDFPFTPNAFQTTINQLDQDRNNGFAAILSADGTQLLYSSFINGKIGAPASRVALEPGCTGSPNCLFYIAGSSTTGNTGTDPGDASFVTTSNAFQSTNPDTVGNSAAYVIVLDPTAGTNGLLYSTFLGGSGRSLPPTTGGDGATGIAVDTRNQKKLIYVTGFTFSTVGSGLTPFPTTTGAFQTDNNAKANQESNAFISVIDPSQTTGSNTLVYSTYIGGSGNATLTPGAAANIATDITLDPGAAGKVWLTGLTFSSDFPTNNPFQSTNLAAANTFSTAFVTHFDTTAPMATALNYSTYLGGSGFVVPLLGGGAGDAGTGIRVDSNGNILVTGGTISSDFTQPVSGNTGCVTTLKLIRSRY